MKQITYSKDALRTLQKMQPPIAKRIREKISLYASAPGSLTNNVITLQGIDPVAYRLRVGDWRVIFTDDGEVVAIIRVAPRGSAYD